MKNAILVIMMMATISLDACQSASNKASEKKSEARSTETPKFSCPMHPEVIGNKGDKCSKCGMELTEPVKK